MKQITNKEYEEWQKYKAEKAKGHIHGRRITLVNMKKSLMDAPIHPSVQYTYLLTVNSNRIAAEPENYEFASCVIARFLIYFERNPAMIQI